MTTSLQNFGFTLIAGMLGSCQTVIEDSYKLDKPLIVVNSIFTPDSTWRAYVTLTKDVGDYSVFRPIEPVINATLKVLDSDKSTVEVLRLSNDACWCYIGETSPVANKLYSIEVVVPGYADLLAVSSTPSVVPIERVEVDSAGYATDETVFMTIVFDDPGLEPNNYHVKILKYISSSRGDEALIFAPLDPSLLNDYSTDQDLFLTDKHFNGEKYSLRLKVARSGYRGVLSPIRVSFENVGTEYYSYFTTMNLQLNSRRDPFAPPMPIAGNVENGVGIFAGYSVWEHTISN